MPPKANKKTGGNGGGRRSGGTAAKRYSRIPRALPLLAAPPHMRSAIMTYTHRYTMTESAAGAGASYFYRLNSVYDPNYTGTGSVAVPYNTWSSVYLNYKVRRATMRVSGTYSGAASSNCIVTLAPLAYQAVLPADANTWRLLPFSVTKHVSNAGDGGQNLVNLVATFDLARVCRITKQQYATDMDWSGQIGSNPSRTVFGGMLMQSVGSPSAGSFIASVAVTYDVEWFNPVPMQ